MITDFNYAWKTYGLTPMSCKLFLIFKMPVLSDHETVAQRVSFSVTKLSYHCTIHELKFVMFCHYYTYPK